MILLLFFPLLLPGISEFVSPAVDLLHLEAADSIAVGRLAARHIPGVVPGVLGEEGRVELVSHMALIALASNIAQAALDGKIALNLLGL